MIDETKNGLVIFDPLCRIASLAKRAQEHRRNGRAPEARKLTTESEKLAAKVLRAGAASLFDYEAQDMVQQIDQHVRLCDLLKNALRGESEKREKPTAIDRVETAIYQFYCENDSWPSNKDLRGKVTSRDLAFYKNEMEKRGKRQLLAKVKIGRKSRTQSNEK